MSRTIIAVDFDGTIVDHRFPAIGRPAPGAFEWMRKWQAEGALLILLTMRSGGRDDGTDPLAPAVEFCRENGVEFWAVNDNPEQHTWTQSRKVYAHRYVDDYAVGTPLLTPADFNGPVVDWETVGPLVLEVIRERRRAFGAGS